MQISILFPLAICSAIAFAQMTVYKPNNPQVIFGGSSSLDSSRTRTGTAAAAAYTGAAAYGPTVLQPPAVPSDPPVTTKFSLQLFSGGMGGMSIKLPGDFYGFSVEMSIANQVLGKNSTFVQVPFLNLMASIKERAGGVRVRIGGNTQESAELVTTIAGGSILSKDYASATGTTNAPALTYTADLLYMMRNISSLAGVRWYLGIPFSHTAPFSLGIMETAQPLLGDFLLGFQAGNEPDLYASHQYRPDTYGPFDYLAEFTNLTAQVADDQLIPDKDQFIIPSVSGTWLPEEVWDTDIVSSFANDISALSVERYPDDNCAAQFNTGQSIKQPQDVFPNYLNHTSATNLVSPYINSTAYAQTVGKPILMFETNTASCGGFPGVSDSFGAAMWALDWGLTMAFNNFSGALLHVGGQNAFYNPFTPPPTNQSTFRKWTIGPVYYSALVMAEILGPSNTSQVFDLGANNNNMYTPAYAVYENGTPTKVVLFNFVTDPSGNTNLSVTIAVGGGDTDQPNATPSSVQVKYLTAESVAQKGNFTWAGQTLGNVFQSDGRLEGNFDVKTIQCDQGANSCVVQVPAPGVAVVFLTPDALKEVTPGSTVTYPTTATTKTVNTAVIDPSILATSNGPKGMGGRLGATSRGSANSAAGTRDAMSGAAVVLALVGGAWLVVAR
ncbi:glycoside hydrolase family 79 protein [Dentipellis sp. KUC8613]|nr:glycoside hydrolase family 79 protein [Dentipellis sp. KUC8613]